MPADREPSWLLGYHRAMAGETALSIPPEYTPAQEAAFISGFMVGARDARDQDLIDEIEDALANE